MTVDHRRPQTADDVAETIAELTPTFEAIVDDLRQEMRKLLEDVEYNNRAQAVNRIAHRPEDIIRPLRNFTTHRLVDLPRTVGDLCALPASGVERCLRELGQIPRGRAQEDFAKLTKYIGVSTPLAPDADES